MDSLYQIVNGLVGNVDWGESLSVAANEFPGLNTTSRREILRNQTIQGEGMDTLSVQFKGRINELEDGNTKELVGSSLG